MHKSAIVRIYLVMLMIHVLTRSLSFGKRSAVTFHGSMKKPGISPVKLTIQTADARG